MSTTVHLIYKTKPSYLPSSSASSDVMTSLPLSQVTVGSGSPVASHVITTELPTSDDIVMEAGALNPGGTAKK